MHDVHYQELNDEQLEQVVGGSTSPQVTVTGPTVQNAVQNQVAVTNQVANAIGNGATASNTSSTSQAAGILNSIHH